MYGTQVWSGPHHLEVSEGCLVSHGRTHLIALGSNLTLKHARSYVPKQGSTTSGVQDVGFATEWHLEAAGRPRLTIHDTRWDGGERDVVLQQVPLLPEMPAALANLHGRHRAGIVEVSAERRRITAFLSLPQPDGRPRQKRALTTAQLADGCGRLLLCELVARPGVSLTPSFDPADPQNIERFQHSVVFEDEDRETPVIAYVLTRLMPTLRHTDWGGDE